MNSHEKERKIIIFGCHFAWIYYEMWNKLGKKVGLRNRTKWIIKKCKEQFNFSLETKEDIKKLDKILIENYYKDKADWLRERVREELRIGK